MFNLYLVNYIKHMQEKIEALSVKGDQLNKLVGTSVKGNLMNNVSINSCNGRTVEIQISNKLDDQRKFLFIYGMGEVVIKNDGQRYLKPGVHYAPEVTLNILSIDMLEKQGFEFLYENDRYKLEYMFKNQKGKNLDEDNLRQMQNNFLKKYFEFLDNKDTGMEEDLIRIKSNIYSTKVQTFNEYVTFLNLIKQDEIMSQEWDIFRNKFDKVVKWFYNYYIEKSLPGLIPPTINGVQIHLFDLYKLVEGLGGYLSVYFGQEFGTIGEILGLSKGNGENIKKCYIKYLDVFTSYYKTARVPQQEYESIFKNPTRKVEEDKDKKCLMSHPWDFGETCAPTANTAVQKGKEELEHFGVKLEDKEEAKNSQLQPIQAYYARNQNLQGSIIGPSTTRKSHNEDTSSNTIEVNPSSIKVATYWKSLMKDPPRRNGSDPFPSEREAHRQGVVHLRRGLTSVSHLEQRAVKDLTLSLMVNMSPTERGRIERGFLSQKGSGGGRDVKEKNKDVAAKDGVLPSLIDKLVVKEKQSFFIDTSIPNVENTDLRSSMKGLNAMLENYRWFIRNNPLILKKWHPDVNLLKEDVGAIPVWVKPHGVLGRSSYGRAMIGLRADVELKDNIVVAMPKITREGHYTCNSCVEYEWKPPMCASCKVFSHYTCNIFVEYEWKPPRCASCKVFGHTHEDCPKNIAGVMKNLNKTCQAPKVVLVNEAGNQLKKVEYPGDHDSKDEVASDDNDMARSLASEKPGFGIQSLLEQ
nr:ARID DNA-binding domain-containing protein [Tanacetum cinerariifolium]